MRITKSKIRSILKEELSRYLKEEHQISSEEVDDIINDPIVTQNLLQYFVDNPAEGEKIIRSAKKMDSVNEGFLDTAKSYYKGGLGANARILATASLPILAALSQAAYLKNPGLYLAGAAGAALLAHLADIALYAKNKKETGKLPKDMQMMIARGDARIVSKGTPRI